MASLNVKAPDGKTLTVNIPDGTDPKNYGAMADDALQHYVSQTTISQDHPGRRMVSQMAHQGLDLAGMVGGGLAGGAIGSLSIPVTGPIGPSAGGVVGAGLGYAALHPLGNVVDRLIGEPVQQPNLAQTVANIPGDITSGMAGELGGKAISAVAKPIAEPFINTFKPDIEALSNELKVPLDLAARSGSQALARLKASLKAMPFTGSIEDQSNVTKEALQGVLKKIIGTDVTADQAPFVGNRVIGAMRDAAEVPVMQARAEAAPIVGNQQISPVSVGKAGVQDITNSSRQHKELVNQLYAAAQQLAGNQKSELPSGTQAADALSSELKDAIGTDPRLLSFVKQIKTQPAAEIDPNVLKGIPQDFLDNPKLKQKVLDQLGVKAPEPEAPKMSFQALKSTIDNLKDLASNENKAIGSNAPGMAYQTSATGRNALRLASALEDDLHNFGGGTQGGLSETLTAAKSLAKQGFDKYNPDVLALAKANPEEFVDKAIVPGDVTNTKNLMSILNPQTKDMVKQSLTNKIFDVEGNGISRETVAKNLAKYGDTLNEIYSKDELQSLRNFAAERGHIVSDNPVFKRFLSDTANTHPAAIVDYVMQPNFGKSVNTIKSVIGEDNAKELENQVLLKMSSNKEGTFSPHSFANAVDKMKPDTLNALFDGDRNALVKKLYTLSDAIRKSDLSAANPSGTANARMFQQLLRMAIFAPAKALGFVGAGSAVSKAYTSELAADILGSPITSAVASAAPQVAAGAGRVAASQNVNDLIGKLRNKYDERRKF